MSTKNQREQLMHGAIGQIAIIFAVLGGSWFYTVPQYTILTDSVTAANGIVDKYSETTKNGINLTELTALLKASKTKDELLTIIGKAPAESTAAIKKTSASENYLDWLNKEIGKSDNDKEKLMFKKARLNSVLPTLNPISNTIIEDTVSMKKYISFVEEKIIKQFNLDSTSSLSIQNIRYGKKGAGAGEMPEVVGSFDNEISFKATNENIIKMIKYINKLGSPEILIATGTINAGIPEIMSNPFAMIDTLSLESNLDASKPDFENNGRMTLRFYIRGSSASDIQFLKSTIASRQTLLTKNINDKYTRCLAEPTCGQKNALQILNRKITEFSKGMSTQKVSAGTELAYSLAAQLDSIKSMEDELKKIK